VWEEEGEEERDEGEERKHGREREHVKGTVAPDFLGLVFFMDLLYIGL
jgi:hypothetical protein